MINLLNKIIKWCDLHAGFIALLAIMVSIITSVNWGSLNLSFTKPFLDWFLAILVYKIKIPLFSLFLIIGIGIVYNKRLKFKYLKKTIDSDFLIGHWNNQWTNDGGHGSEICEIKKGGEYFLMGEHWFDLKNIKYDSQKNSLTFIKTAVQEGDTRKALNILTVKSEDELIGQEDGNPIRYIRQN